MDTSDYSPYLSCELVNAEAENALGKPSKKNKPYKEVLGAAQLTRIDFTLL